MIAGVGNDEPAIVTENAVPRSKSLTARDKARCLSHAGLPRCVICETGCIFSGSDLEVNFPAAIKNLFDLHLHIVRPNFTGFLVALIIAPSISNRARKLSSQFSLRIFDQICRRLAEVFRQSLAFDLLSVESSGIAASPKSLFLQSNFFPSCGINQPSAILGVVNKPGLRLKLFIYGVRQE